jgi:hypothetical protein
VLRATTTWASTDDLALYMIYRCVGSKADIFSHRLPSSIEPSVSVKSLLPVGTETWAGRASLDHIECKACAGPVISPAHPGLDR